MNNPKWITVEVNGGLGNQLYQIFAAIAFSLKMNRPFYFRYEPRIFGHASVRETYWDNFLLDLSGNVLHDSNEIERRNRERIVIYEQGHHYSPIICPDSEMLFPEIYCLGGYFQSYKYFENDFEHICKITGIRNRQEEFRKECEEHDFTLGEISMHFRLGDYIHLTDIHPIMPREYYRNALRFLVDHIRSTGVERKINVVYFCEESDNEYIFGYYMEYLINLFPECEFILADQNLPDWKQLMYMSLCDHHIIGNSTFSLWGAQLNPSTEKQICYPWKWFTDEFIKRDRRFVHDMFPPSWNKVGWLFHRKGSLDYSY